ncbi:MAG: hypothetical protein GY940_27405 [bacterium]|nr:hypothetical protein [bacterium]
MKKAAILIIVLLISGMFAHTAAKSRNYMLAFETTTYSKQLEDAVNGFLDNIFQPGDQLMVVTPMRMVKVSPKRLAASRPQLTAALFKTLKADIAAYSVQMQGIPKRDLAIGGYYEAKITKYADIFRKNRGDNQLMLIMGQKLHAIRAYGYNTPPQPRDFGYKALAVSPGRKFDIKFDRKKIHSLFRYANIRFHFLYLKAQKLGNERGYAYRDETGDIYTEFTKLAKATNGIKVSSIKPVSFVKKVRRALLAGTVEVEVVDQSMKK